MGAPIPESPYSHADWMGASLARVTATGAPGFRFFAPEAPKIALDLADADSIRVVRLEHAKPRYGEDIFGTTPCTQETQQSMRCTSARAAILGQDVVERMRSAGHWCNRMLVGLSIDSADAPLSRGIPDVSQRTAKKQARSHPRLFPPALGKVVGMGLCSGREFGAEPGTALTVNGHKAEVRPLLSV